MGLQEGEADCVRCHFVFKNRQFSTFKIFKSPLFFVSILCVYLYWTGHPRPLRRFTRVRSERTSVSAPLWIHAALPALSFEGFLRSRMM